MSIVKTTSWISCAFPPPFLDKEKWDYKFESKPVLAVFKDKTQHVVKAVQDAELNSPSRWKTCCSEEFIVTEEVRYWQDLPSIEGLEI